MIMGIIGQTPILVASMLGLDVAFFVVPSLSVMFTSTLFDLGVKVGRFIKSQAPAVIELELDVVVFSVIGRGQVPIPTKKRGGDSAATFGLNGRGVLGSNAADQCCEKKGFGDDVVHVCVVMWFALFAF